MLKELLFRGEFITDYGMGNGYANLVKASLGMDHPMNICLLTVA